MPEPSHPRWRPARRWHLPCVLFTLPDVRHGRALRLVRVRRAQVTPHKPALLAKFGEWQAGTLPTAELVQIVEELYDKNVLETGLFDDWDE